MIRVRDFNSPYDDVLSGLTLVYLDKEQPKACCWCMKPQIAKFTFIHNISGEYGYCLTCLIDQDHNPHYIDDIRKMIQDHPEIGLEL